MAIGAPYCSYFKGEQGCDKCVGNTGFVSQGFSSHQNCNCQPPAPRYGKDDYERQEYRNIKYELQGKQTHEQYGEIEIGHPTRTTIVELKVYVDLPGAYPEVDEFRSDYSFGIEDSISEQHELEPGESAALMAKFESEDIIISADVYNIFPDGKARFAGVKSDSMEVIYEDSLRWRVIDM